MIQRREFMGAMVASWAVAGTSQHVFADHPDHTLNWPCQVIQMLPHEHVARAPVATGVALQPGGVQVAIVGDDHYVCIYDKGVQEFVAHLRDHTDWVRTTKFSPDGKLLGSAGNDRKLRLWNTANYDLPARIYPHRQAVIDVAFSSDSRQIASVGFNSDLRIFDTTADKQIRRLTCECADNHAVAFSGDDTKIAAGGRSGVIRVWDTQTGDLLTQVKPHRQRIRSLDFSTAGEIVSCGDDQLVSISNLEQPRKSRTLPRRGAKLFDVTLLTDDLLATSGSDNLIHIWKLADSSLVGTLKGHRGTVSCLDYSGKEIASGGFDTQVRIWEFRGGPDPAGRQTNLTDGWSRLSFN